MCSMGANAYVYICECACMCVHVCDMGACICVGGINLFILHSSIFYIQVFTCFYICQFEKSHDTRKWVQLFPFSVALLCPRLEV